jgi:hypothetical protein
MREALERLDYLLPHPIRTRIQRALWEGHECGQLAVRQAIRVEAIKILCEEGFDPVGPVPRHLNLV